MADLFSPLRVGSLELPNRIWMAPLTRCRAAEGHVPGTLMAEHYSQRATAGLIVAEATMAMEGNSAFWHEPGITNQAQIDGWRLTNEAVHRAGGRIVLQIWHGGRACHPLLNDGRQPVAPSPIAITGDEVHTPQGKQPYVTPRELGDDELPAIVEGFRLAARNAMAAGFDGVEVHGANGYLLDEFLRDGSNQRSGPYGGALENRARLLLEVLEAVAEETPLPPPALLIRCGPNAAAATSLKKSCARPVPSCPASPRSIRTSTPACRTPSASARSSSARWAIASVSSTRPICAACAASKRNGTRPAPRCRTCARSA
jgi:N-ethylmaleimide reductase